MGQGRHTDVVNGSHWV